MSSSPKNHTSYPQNQTTPQIKYSIKSHLLPTYTPPPLLQFTPTFGARGSTRLKRTPMTYEQYVDLKKEYQAMVEELKMYNEFKASQQRLTTSWQCLQRPNLDKEGSDSQETQTSSKSWKSRYSSADKSGEASEPSSTRTRRRKS